MLAASDAGPAAEHEGTTAAATTTWVQRPNYEKQTTTL